MPRITDLPALAAGQFNGASVFPMVGADNITAKVAAQKIGIPFTPQMFGAKADGVADDTVALGKCLAAAVGYSYPGVLFGFFPATPETIGAYVYLPPGLYRITGNLADLTAYGLAQGRMQAVVIRGAGPLKSRMLIDMAAGSYLFDNWDGGIAPFQTFISPEFKDVSFQGPRTDSTAPNLMRLWSDGQSAKSPTFEDCYFYELGVVLNTKGAANADQGNFTRCKFFRCWTNILLLENVESVCWTFLGCEVGECYCDALFASPLGGGMVYWFGGSIINGYKASDGGKDSDQYIFSLTGTAAGNNRFVITSCRFEMPSIYSKLVYSNSTGGGNDCTFRVTFDNCSWSGIQTGATPREVVTVWDKGLVEFVGCQLPTQTSLVSTLTYGVYSTSLNNQGATVRPTVAFRNTEIPRFDPTNFTFGTAGCGKFLARECYNMNVETIVPSNPAYAMDWDYPSMGGRGITDAPAKLHEVILHNNGTNWPNNTNAASGYNETAVVLPDGATIMDILVYKPAQGSDANTYQLSVGTNDKLTVYGTSNSGRYDALHTITLTNQLIACGSSLNTQTVRLWASTLGGVANHTLGWAVVRYY
jgi:hypothetical protein